MNNDRTTIVVTCRCGARLEITTNFQSDARGAADEFYLAHKACVELGALD